MLTKFLASRFAPARCLWLLVGALIVAPGFAVAAPAAADAIVATDGTGRYRTIREAIDAAPQIPTDTGRRWTILVKPGIYRELVYVPREKRFITLQGEDAQKTVLLFDLYATLPGPDDKAIGTFRTPTLTVDADDFTAENLTVENAAGPRGPAVALRLDGDRIVVRRCRLLGWQNTVLVNRGRHYFEGCQIEGAVDFIFGGGTAYFERCQIRCLGAGFITASSTPEQQIHGFVFSHCTITGTNPDLPTFLGRPARDYAKVVFLHTEMAANVQAAGWDSGRKVQVEKTVFMAEFANKGPGATLLERAPWSKHLTPEEAASLSRENVLAGSDAWDPTREPRRPRRKKSE